MAEVKKFARRCDITKKGINEGYCIMDGEMYISSQVDILKHLHENTDYKSIQEAFDEGYCYYTEWEEVDEDEYYLADGTLVVIEAEEVEMSAEDMEEERGIDMLEDDRQSNW